MRRCDECRSRYGNWANLGKKDREARRVDPRRSFERSGPMRVTFSLASGNAKTGRIPVSITSANSCPPSCGLYGKGCYAEYGLLRFHWRNAAETGTDWAAFCRRVGELEPGQLWRHNEAGDLPGLGAAIDVKALRSLLYANLGRRGFTFTHKPVFASKHVSAATARANAIAIWTANEAGFVVNLSADSLDEADRMAELGIAPVVVVLPTDTPDRGVHTPGGRRVVVCPAQTSDLTCETCQLCAKPRKAIVGFRAHGQLKALVSDLVQLRPKPRAEAS